MQRIIALLVMAFLCSYQTSLAQIITDRPDQTESSSTVSKSSLQIETGILILHEESPTTQIRDIAAPTTLFRYGITDGLELRIFSQYEIRRVFDFGLDLHSSGMSDTEIGLKFQILKKENINAEIAFLTHLVTPSGSLGFTRDEWGTINKLSIAHSLSDNIGIGYNIGYDYLGIGSGNITYSLAIGFSLTNKLGSYMEYYGSIEDIDQLVHDLDAGLTYLVKENIQLDLSYGIGINHKSNYLSFGLSLNIHD